MWRIDLFSPITVVDEPFGRPLCLIFDGKTNAETKN